MLTKRRKKNPYLAVNKVFGAGKQTKIKMRN